jgi:hypothetical protein
MNLIIKLKILLFNLLSGSVILEPSYTIFDGLVFGRFSFNGFNPQIEVINEHFV